MLQISNTVTIADDEIKYESVRAQGPGGQHVNKVSTAIHLRFDIKKSSLPDIYKERLLALSDHRISKDGVIVIKAQRYKSRKKNIDDSGERLKDLIQKAMAKQKKRKPTRLSKNKKKKRLDAKKRHGKLKALRGKVRRDD